MPRRQLSCSKHVCFLRCVFMYLLISGAFAPPIVEPVTLHTPPPVSPIGGSTITTVATLVLVVLFAIIMLHSRAPRASAIIKRLRCVHCNAPFTGLKTFRVHHRSCAAAATLECASLVGQACDSCCIPSGTAALGKADARCCETRMHRIVTDVVAAAQQDATLPSLMERLYALAERGKVLFEHPVYTGAQADYHLEEANAMLERCNELARVCPQHSCQAVMINAIGAEKSNIFSVHQPATIADYAKTLARFLAFLKEVENFCILHLQHSLFFVG